MSARSVRTHSTSYGCQCKFCGNYKQIHETEVFQGSWKKY